MDKLLRISQAAQVLGVSASTLRRWEREGKITPERTEGKHRLYRLSQFNLSKQYHLSERKTIAYARVSSHDQKSDLERQKKVLEMYCASHGWRFDLISDLGSGMNYYKSGKPNQCKLRRKLNSIKRDQFPWMLEVTKNAPQMAIIQLGQAFRNFFAKRAAYPTFRKKWRDDRFTLTNDQFTVNGSRIRIPHLSLVRMRERLRYSGKMMSATLSRRADKWFVSITVDTPIPLPVNDNQVAVGVDLGVSEFATLSSGKEIIGPKPHKALLARQKRLSRSLSRKQKGSKNRTKARIKLARLHRRIANVRQNAIHQLTTELTRNFSLIAIEDLNVKGMMRNRKLSRSIAGFHWRTF